VPEVHLISGSTCRTSKRILFSSNFVCLLAGRGRKDSALTSANVKELKLLGKPTSSASSKLDVRRISWHPDVATNPAVPKQ
jgi:hypothetical protein